MNRSKAFHSDSVSARNNKLNVITMKHYPDICWINSKNFAPVDVDGSLLRRRSFFAFLQTEPHLLFKTDFVLLQGTLRTTGNCYDLISSHLWSLSSTNFGLLRVFDGCLITGWKLIAKLDGGRLQPVSRPTMGAWSHMLRKSRTGFWG